MSAMYVSSVSCDGPSLGLHCAAGRRIFESNLNEARAILRRQGWRWKPHGDVRVDLCPSCLRDAVLKPATHPSPGRPRRG